MLYREVGHYPARNGKPGGRIVLMTIRGRLRVVDEPEEGPTRVLPAAPPNGEEALLLAERALLARRRRAGVADPGGPATEPEAPATESEDSAAQPEKSARHPAAGSPLG